MFFSFEFMSPISKIIFLLIILIFLISIVTSILTWNKNNNSPRLTVSAKVASRRIHRTGSIADASGNTTSSTSYYATFQVDSGDRIEFHVSKSEYDVLIEGDLGKLSFQGSRYINFTRDVI